MNLIPPWLPIVLVMLILLIVTIGAFIAWLRATRRNAAEDREAWDEIEGQLQQHDRTVRWLTPEGFERHKRTCPRCRGDVLGHRSISTEQLTDFRR